MSGKEMGKGDVWEQTAGNEPISGSNGYDITRTSDGKLVLSRFNKQYNLNINLEFETVKTGNTKKLLELLSDAYMEKSQDNTLKMNYRRRNPDSKV